MGSVTALVAGVVVVASGVVPGVGIYYLVPWGRVRSMGSGDVSDRTARSVRVGMSLGIGGSVAFAAGSVVWLFGALSTPVGVVVLGAATLACCGGIGVPSVLLVLDTFGG